MNTAYSAQASSHNITLAQGTTTIGRANTNVIVLPFDTNCHHAIIVTLSNIAFIHDLGNTRDVYVNGKPVDYHVLHLGDRVEIGDYHFNVVGFQ